jgi:hypothetical protein
MNAIWSVHWSNPYTKPPEDKAWTLLERAVDWDTCDHSVPHDIVELAQDNPGYTIGWTWIPKESKHWSPEAVRRNRIRRIKKRAEKKCPLFQKEVAEQDIERYKKKGWL